MAELTSLFSSEAAAVPSAPTAPSLRALRIPMRPVKIGIGVTLLMAGVYGIVSGRQYLSTDNAVVTAYVAEVRSPIDGILSGMPASSGGRIAQGALLGSVDNRLYDQQHLDNLSILEQQARSGADAARMERAALDGQERELLDRAALHMRAVSTRLAQQKTEAERLLAARGADLDEARRELDRGKQLHDAGILADSQYEKLQSQYHVAEAEEAAQRASVAAAQIELQAAAAGVLSEPGTNNDVPYSRQRADEVEMRVAEIDRSREELDAQAEKARSDVGSEAQRMDAMRHSDLLAPVAGMLWKLEAVNGERVGTGDPVARVVACEQSFVLAEVPQERVPEIAIGAPVRLRLTGETQDRYGKVSAISGDPQLDSDLKLAAFPPENPRQRLATVRISIVGPGADDCAIGRSARVLISIADSTLLDRIWRRYL